MKPNRFIFSSTSSPYLNVTVSMNWNGIISWPVSRRAMRKRSVISIKKNCRQYSVFSGISLFITIITGWKLPTWTACYLCGACPCKVCWYPKYRNPTPNLLPAEIIYLPRSGRLKCCGMSYWINWKNRDNRKIRCPRRSKWPTSGPANRWTS